MSANKIATTLTDCPSDILLLLCNVLDVVDIKSVSRVCNLLRSITLPRAWRTVHNVLELFNVLSALRKKGRRVFKRPPSVSDWKSFESVARHVQNLYCRSEDVDLDVIDEVFRAACFQRPMLPNLRNLALEIYGDTNDIHALSLHILFLHPGIEKISIYELPPMNARCTSARYNLHDFFDDVLALASNITFLCITSSDHPTEDDLVKLEKLIGDVITRLPQLQEVQLDACFFTFRVLRALSSLPQLAIATVCDARRDAWNKQGPLCISPNVSTYTRVIFTPGESWPRLQCYSAIMCLEQVTETLQDSSFPADRLIELMVLSVASWSRTSQEVDPNSSKVVEAGEISGFLPSQSVQNFLATVAERCHQLIRLDLNLCSPYFWEETNTSPLDKHDLSPWLNATQLTSIRVHDGRHVELSEEDLVNLVQPLVHIVEFCLCSTPEWRVVPDVDGGQLEGAPQHLIAPPSLFSLRTVGRLIDALPVLRRLGLYLDVSLDEVAFTTAGKSHIAQGSLDCLDVGSSSPPSDALPLSVLNPYLNRQGRLIFGLTSGVQWESWRTSELFDGMKKELSGWERFALSRV